MGGGGESRNSRGKIIKGGGGAPLMTVADVTRDLAENREEIGLEKSSCRRTIRAGEAFRFVPLFERGGSTKPAALPKKTPVKDKAGLANGLPSSLRKIPCTFRSSYRKKRK